MCAGTCPCLLHRHFYRAAATATSSRWGVGARRLAPQFVDFAAIASAACVLDVGCGTGSLSFCLAEDLEILGVQGIDASPEYIAYARRKNDDARLTFQIGDACTLPFPDASFDHALSMLVLQFIPRAELAVREMRRVTRRGGTVAAATWDSRGGLVAQRIILDTAAVLDPNGNEFRARTCTRPMSRPGDLARAWREAGLVDVVLDMLTIRMEFASFADFWAPAEGRDGPIADYVSTLGPDMRAELRDMVQQAYFDGDVDGVRSYAATAWVVKGKAP
jgi:ubiquinone/menaquinone biosynthesis C-methylase UbiE